MIIAVETNLCLIPYRGPVYLIRVSSWLEHCRQRPKAVFHDFLHLSAHQPYLWGTFRAVQTLLVLNIPESRRHINVPFFINKIIY